MGVEPAVWRSLSSQADVAEETLKHTGSCQLTVGEIGCVRCDFRLEIAPVVQCGVHRWAGGSAGPVRGAWLHLWYLSAGCLYRCSKENPDPRPYVQNPQTRTTCPAALNLSHTFLSPPHANAEVPPPPPTTSSTPWEEKHGSWKIEKHMWLANKHHMHSVYPHPP